MKTYHYSIVSTDYMDFLIVEDSDTWEAAILDWDLLDEDIESAIKCFESGVTDVYVDEYNSKWYSSVEELFYNSVVTNVRNLCL